MNLYVLINSYIVDFDRKYRYFVIDSREIVNY